METGVSQIGPDKLIEFQPHFFPTSSVNAPVDAAMLVHRRGFECGLVAFAEEEKTMTGGEVRTRGKGSGGA